MDVFLKSGVPVLTACPSSKAHLGLTAAVHGGRALGGVCGVGMWVSCLCSGCLDCLIFERMA